MSLERAVQLMALVLRKKADGNGQDEQKKTYSSVRNRKDFSFGGPAPRKWNSKPNKTGCNI